MGRARGFKNHLQSDRDVLVARGVIDILHFHHQPWIMPPPSSPPTPVRAFSGLSGLLGLQPAGRISGGRINGGASLRLSCTMAKAEALLQNREA